MTFETKKELAKWLADNDYAQLSDGDWYPTGTYYLAHGEYSQPEFSLRRYKDGWSLHGYYHFHRGTICSKENGRVSDEFYLR